MATPRGQADKVSTERAHACVSVSGFSVSRPDAAGLPGLPGCLVFYQAISFFLGSTGSTRHSSGIRFPSPIPSQRRLTQQLTKQWPQFKALRQQYAGTRFEEQRQLHLPQKHKATVPESTLRVEMNGLEEQADNAKARDLFWKPLSPKTDMLECLGTLRGAGPRDRGRVCIKKWPFGSPNGMVLNS
jgi:hypothetical protein